VVRDLTDINHPKTVGNLGPIFGPVFVSGTEISYANDTGLFRMPLRGSPKALVVKHGGGGAWSPDGKAVVYTTFNSTDSCTGTNTVHQLRAGHDQVLGSVPSGGCGDCQTNCGFENWLDARLLYSPDGASISFVMSGFGAGAFRVWSADGRKLIGDDSKGATMSAWSGPGLYFRDQNGVEVWRGGVISQFLPGVTWITPRASPAGDQIVYVVRDSGGWAHTYVVDTAMRTVRELKKARSHPAFLTSRFIWYEGERACVAADQCGANPPSHPLSGKTYIYDLQTGTETESIITSVSDVWPHPA
jgi:Tol biopolymer transport system component